MTPIELLRNRRDEIARSLEHLTTIVEIQRHPEPLPTDLDDETRTKVLADRADRLDRTEKAIDDYLADLAAFDHAIRRLEP